MLKKIIAIVLIIILSACHTVPNDALVLQQESLQMRSMQTRIFNTQDDMALLSPSVNVLQDLGFDIDFTEKELGIVIGSKITDATDYGEIASRVLMTALLNTELTWSDEQKIKASLFVVPFDDRMKVRVTFQRIIWDNRGQITTLQPIEDAEIYQDFFSRVSKSVFLDAHKI